MTMRLSSLSLSLFAILLLALSVGGCSKDKEKKLATQVAAKVNGDEISVHQINNVLSRTQGIPPEMADKARREVLDKLIDQQLAVQQATEKKLDRSPDVMMAIEAAKQEILARAYFDQLLAAQAKPSVEEAKKYYADHPALFAQRRVYNLQEIVMPAQGAPLAKLRELAANKPIDDIVKFLKEQNVRFSANAVTRPAEQVPLEILPKLAELKDGQTGVFEMPNVVSVLRIAASQSAVVDEATAVPRIQQFLANKAANEAVAAELKQLKDKAKIEIVADFSKADANATANAAAPAAEPAKGEVKPDVKAEAKPEGKPDSKAAETKSAAAGVNIEKGVAGLK
jgi:EpsD family peptidyl-prolyl cis-trans isomerase